MPSAGLKTHQRINLRLALEEVIGSYEPNTEHLTEWFTIFWMSTRNIQQPDVLVQQYWHQRWPSKTSVRWGIAACLLGRHDVREVMGTDAQGKDEDRGKRWMRPRDQDGEKAGKTERKMLRDVGALPQFSEYWSGVQVLEDGSWTPLLSSPRSPPPPPPCLALLPPSFTHWFCVLYSTLAVSRVWGGKDFHSLPPLSNPRLSPSP